MKVYLDDVRMPSYTYPSDADEDWVIVRDYHEFVDLLAKSPQPDVISFDHDLGDDPLSGMDCSKWLVERALDGHTNLHAVEIRVHSANPAGAANMRGLFDGYLKNVPDPTLT